MIELLNKRMGAALVNIHGITPQNVWNELNYRIDVCRVTKGAHLEYP